MRFAASVRRRLRWIAIAALVALVSYPLSLGPVSYLMFRDATPVDPFAPILEALYRPLWVIADMTGFAGHVSDYQDYFITLAAHHDGRDNPPPIIPPYPRDDLPE